MLHRIGKAYSILPTRLLDLPAGDLALTALILERATYVEGLTRKLARENPDQEDLTPHLRAAIKTDIRRREEREKRAARGGRDSQRTD